MQTVLLQISVALIDDVPSVCAVCKSEVTTNLLLSSLIVLVFITSGQLSGTLSLLLMLSDRKLSSDS